MIFTSDIEALRQSCQQIQQQLDSLHQLKQNLSNAEFKLSAAGHYNAWEARAVTSEVATQADKLADYIQNLEYWTDILQQALDIAYVSPPQPIELDNLGANNLLISARTAIQEVMRTGKTDISKANAELQEAAEWFAQVNQRLYSGYFIGLAASALLNNVSVAANNLFAQADQNVATALGSLFQEGQHIANQVGNFVFQSGENAANAVASGVVLASSLVAATATTVSNAVATTVEDAEEGASNLVSTAESTAENVITDIGNGFKALFGDVTSAIDNAINAARNAFNAIMRGGEQVLATAGNGLLEGLNIAKNGAAVAVQDGQQALDFVGNIFQEGAKVGGGLFGGIGDLFSGLGNLVSSIINPSQPDEPPLMTDDLNSKKYLNQPDDNKIGKYAKLSDSQYLFNIDANGKYNISPNDVRQGNDGDCYFMASLAAIAEKNPELIEQMIQENPDGTYTVTFPKYQGGFLGIGEHDQIKITVKGDFPVDKNNNSLLYARTDPANSNGPIWPLIIEKAYAQYKGGYQQIDGGSEWDALTFLTGKDSQHLSSHHLFGVGDFSFDDINNAFQSGHPIVANTDASNEDETDLPDGQAVYNAHAYTVSAIDQKTHEITLRNPWGFDDLKLSFDDFKKYFYDVGIN